MADGRKKRIPDGTLEAFSHTYLPISAVFHQAILLTHTYVDNYDINFVFSPFIAVGLALDRLQMFSNPLTYNKVRTKYDWF